MGFDPRSWARVPARGAQVTANIDALLAENEALRREVAHLRGQLFRRQSPGPACRGDVSAEWVQVWGEALASHPRWRELRVGASARVGERLVFSGLRGLLEHLRGQWSDPRAQLEEELDRRLPGLGSSLRQALRGPQTKSRLAVRLAFAIYGVRAPEWLSESPLRVVDDLLERIAALEQEAARPAPAEDSRDHERAAAFALLGLRRGASREAIKRAHRRLVKTHHPDQGGSVDDFRRIHAAYQLLMA
ncbi:J domain-containing protein [Synechococcus sp. EJ6-Ellesmere]|uniref:J domain-containing protein n=1 Tax=Synechococcus sp. EJ6-Ellesmere TaxID=2823734 RepID=UPI0020CC16A4|nr:J domain-containing protein [Synechococcus sp. EJ6-Ellesmere]MCP9825826.1 DnaJ domain-containing protein [Synechococcus sp. EJ6-Ellesmere]